MNLRTLKQCWNVVRELSGDDAYERYLEHWRVHHAHDGGQPLSRSAYFKAEQERKWNGIRRCC